MGNEATRSFDSFSNILADYSDQKIVWDSLDLDAINLSKLDGEILPLFQEKDMALLELNAINNRFEDGSIVKKQVKFIGFRSSHRGVE